MVGCRDEEIDLDHMSFVELSRFMCCRGYDLLLPSRTNESRAVLCCLHYDLLHFWLLWEKDKT